jgi:predicted nucleic acid-binding protein
VVDTNVLLSATDRTRSAHQSATRFLDTDERRLALTPQIVREYLAVATRPLDANGFGLSGQDAADNVQQLLEDMDLLSESSASTRRLTDLVGSGSAAGRQVHDANIVAVALAHGASTIVTDDARYFARFADVIEVETLTSGP